MTYVPKAAVVQRRKNYFIYRQQKFVYPIEKEIAIRQFEPLRRRKAAEILAGDSMRYFELLPGFDRLCRIDWDLVYIVKSIELSNFRLSSVKRFPPIDKNFKKWLRRHSIKAEVFLQFGNMPPPDSMRFVLWSRFPVCAVSYDYVRDIGTKAIRSAVFVLPVRFLYREKDFDDPHVVKVFRSDHSYLWVYRYADYLTVDECIMIDLLNRCYCGNNLDRCIRAAVSLDLSDETHLYIGGKMIPAIATKKFNVAQM